MVFDLSASRRVQRRFVGISNDSFCQFKHNIFWPEEWEFDFDSKFLALWKIFEFLGLFAELLKATYAFVLSALLFLCPSVHPHGTARLSLNGFWWNLVFWALVDNVSKRSKSHWVMTRIMGTLREYPCVFVIICHWILFITRHVSNKICRESENTFSVQLCFFFENRSFYEVM
jgi:hypothetical protein